ncbi:hypothetical protein MNBD_GAMMA18-131 [hydrothermal vent metagenome]|uniref:Uncharacterized protein n=1 Tax=hydrothermal vent metagenome TaxID=652676 RepID=A0A3B0YY49_9ZZZZ
MWPHEPYTVGETTDEEARILRALYCGSPRNIHKLSAAAGQDNIVGISKAMTMLHDTTAAMVGAAASVHTSRSNEFVRAVQYYQDTLLAYRDVMQGKGTAGATKASAGAAIRTAFGEMQKQFQHELSMTTSSQRALSLKGIPLTNITRAKNIARSSRSIEKLQLTSVIQAGAVGRFSKYGKALGNGLIVVDVASRIGNVQNEYKADGNWERELFIESSSFAASALAGTIAVKAGVTFFMIATPVGWVGLIVTAATASVVANYIAKEKSGDWYDNIMEWLNTL